MREVPALAIDSVYDGKHSSGLKARTIYHQEKRASRLAT
jgi:hypothetical protein